MVAFVIEWFARHAWWPLGWAATVWAGFGARRPLSGFAARMHLHTLVDVLAHGRDPIARWHAGWTLGRLWARSDRHRKDIWQSVWGRFSPPLVLPFSDLPTEEPETDMSYALVRFLLGPDPATSHVPPVRLVAGMSSDDEIRAAERVVVLCQSAGSSRTRAHLTDLLTRTDEPHLLAALERAFTLALRPGRYAFARARSIDEFTVPPLWNGPDNSPSDLLTVLLNNPHLPRSGDGHRGDEILAILAVLRDRSDLLDRFDQRQLVRTLLYFLMSQREGNSPAREIARSVLSTIGPGPGREEICRLAMHVDAGSVAIGVLAEAARIAAAAGYRPADPAAEPLFLVMTDQWQRFRALDPDGSRLRAYGLGPGDGAPYRVYELLEMLDESWRSDAAVTAACTAMLGDVCNGAAARTLCEKAEQGSGTAIAVVTASGLVPDDERRRPAFLFLTGQWRRYEAADPDGRRLRSYAAKLGSHDPERDRLRAAARAGDRPEPCEPALPHWATTPPSGSHGGHGVSGSGGYFNAGSDFSVHGV